MNREGFRNIVELLILFWKQFYEREVLKKLRWKNEKNLWQPVHYLSWSAMRKSFSKSFICSSSVEEASKKNWKKIFDSLRIVMKRDERKVLKILRSLVSRLNISLIVRLRTGLQQNGWKISPYTYILFNYVSSFMNIRTKLNLGDIYFQKDQHQYISERVRVLSTTVLSSSFQEYPKSLFVQKMVKFYSHFRAKTSIPDYLLSNRESARAL